MYTKGIHKEGEDLEMNTLVIVLIAAVLLTAAYFMAGGFLKNGELIQRRKHQHINLKMDRIMFRPMAGQYLVISFLLLREQDL